MEGPVVDHDQTGYGAAYRIYQGGDGAWFALAVTDAEAWDGLRAVVGVEPLPDGPPPLRTGRGEGRQPAEKLLEELFRTKPAAAWVNELSAAGVPVELAVEYDRAGFIASLFDDPVNRERGRVVTFDWGPRGRTEQPAFPLVFGPAPRPPAPVAGIPGLGEHTGELLEALGFDAAEREALADAKVIPT